MGCFAPAGQLIIQPESASTYTPRTKNRSQLTTTAVTWTSLTVAKPISS